MENSEQAPPRRGRLETPFPVIDPRPTFDTVVSNIKMQDYAIAAGITIASGVFTFAGGAHHLLPHHPLLFSQRCNEGLASSPYELRNDSSPSRGTGACLVHHFLWHLGVWHQDASDT